MLAEHKTPAEVFDRALRAEQAGDCDAAVVLFNDAANKSPEMAGQLARRYDPVTFTADGCFEQADEPYAIIYYGDAANAGITSAQRRLGLLMTGRERSGPTFERGLEWLRQAADGGDPEARRRLDELEN